MQSFEKLGIALPVSELASLLSFWAEGQRSTENGHSGASPAHVEHLDFQGFYDFYRFLCQEDTRDGRVDETDLRAAFDLYDKNNDGFISVTELQSVLVSLGFEEATNLGKCKSMIESIDSNGDGVVSFDEFKAMMRTMEDV
ncbi:hypothetical protein KP509_06G016200 [Ceratopteris richardii]|nr:hypothetical protein KP509_06G016200 [Ceratopteris richardii]